MRAQVVAAGGIVLADLSQIDALAVVPRANGFAARVAASRSVTDLFPDTLFTSDHFADGPRGGGQGNGPGDGAGSSAVADPGPSPSQRDDDTMTVQPAWR